MKFYLLIFILTENYFFKLWEHRGRGTNKKYSFLHAICIKNCKYPPPLSLALTLNWFRACNILVFMVHWTEENQFFYFLLLCFQTCILFLFEGIFKLNGIENLFWWLPSTIHCGSFNVIHHQSVTESVKMT